jgi:hypothetical protein
MDGRRSTNGGNDVLDHDPHFRDYVWFYEVSQTSTARLAIISQLHSSISTATTEGDSVLPIRLAGPGWWRTTFFKVELAVASPKPQRVRLISAQLFDKVAPTESSVWIAPRSLARHYFDVSDPYFSPRVLLTIPLGKCRHDVRCWR